MGQKTGMQILRNPTLMQAITDGLASGVPKQQLCKQLRVGPETLDIVLASSEVEDYERESIERLERIQSTQLTHYEKALDAGKVNVNSIPVHYGIFADKRALLLNDTQASNDGSGPSVQSILADLKSVKPVQVNVQVNIAQAADGKTVTDVKTVK